MAAAPAERVSAADLTPGTWVRLQDGPVARVEEVEADTFVRVRKLLPGQPALALFWWAARACIVTTPTPAEEALWLIATLTS